MSDHVLDLETLSTPYPYTKDGKRRWEPCTPWLDPWVAIGAMGAVTERLRFTTNVYVLPMRNPFVVAKAVATAAVLTGGRVSLGIGMGWCEEEFELMEQPFAKRGARADEMLAADGAAVDRRGRRAPRRLLRHPPARDGAGDAGADPDRTSAACRRPRCGGRPATTAGSSDFATIDELGEFRRRIEEHREALGRTDVPFSHATARPTTR